MPAIRIDIGKQSINSEQKKQLIEKFTAIAVEVTHIPLNAFSVIINEHDNTNYGGGVTLDKICVFAYELISKLFYSRADSVTIAQPPILNNYQRLCRIKRVEEL